MFAEQMQLLALFDKRSAGGSARQLAAPMMDRTWAPIVSTLACAASASGHRAISWATSSREGPRSCMTVTLCR